MTEAEWNACADPEAMLGFLHGKASDRKLRWFSLACVHRFRMNSEHLERSRNAIAALEDHLEGRVSASEFHAASREALAEIESNLLNQRLQTWAVSDMVHALLANPAHAAAVRHAQLSMDFAYAAVIGHFEEGESDDEAWERATRPVAIPLCQWLRDLFGPLPFRPIDFAPAWRTAPVMALAEAVQRDQAFDRLPVLGDALEEAGCASIDLLDHCRGHGQHIRGCWVIDLLLGKE